MDDHARLLMSPADNSGYAPLLVGALRGLTAATQDGEVAFLALTGKIENQIRDRVAWSLHQMLSSRLVAREWMRRDLVILGRGLPQAFVEFKAMYSFDAVWPQKQVEYSGHIARDVEKMTRPHRLDAELFEVVLSTHVGTRVGPDLKGVVKYIREANKALTQLGDDGLLQESRRQLRRILSSWGAAERIKLAHGRPWAIDTVVDAWLVGPIQWPQSVEGLDLTQI